MTAGRPRKFKNRDIVQHTETGQLYAIVGHRTIGTKAQYRCMPLNGRLEKYGRTIWIISAALEATGMVSNQAVITTYNSNRMLDDGLPEGRGCDCDCCVHVAMPIADWTHMGRMRGTDDE